MDIDALLADKPANQSTDVDSLLAEPKSAGGGRGSQGGPTAAQLRIEEADKAVKAKLTPVSSDNSPGWFEPGSKSEAAVRGFSSLGTLGFGDEASAAVRSLTTGQSYKSLRDEQRAANEAAYQANPGSYAAGGALAIVPTLAAAAPKFVASTLGGKALQAATTGAGIGGVSGAGNSEADSLEGVAADAVEGAGLGAATGGALATVPTIAGPVSRFAAKRAANFAAGALSPSGQVGFATVSPAALMHLGAASALATKTGRNFSNRVVGSLERLGTKPSNLLTYDNPGIVRTAIDRLSGAAGKVAERAIVQGTGSAVADIAPTDQTVLTDEITTAPASVEPSQTVPASFDVNDLLKDEQPSSGGVDIDSLLSQAPQPAPKASNYIDKAAKIESGNNPNARNPNSSASGTFQFTDGTWKEMVAKYGEKLGISNAMKSDPVAQRKMMELFTRDNQAGLKADNIPVNDASSYAAHFLGLGGARTFFNSPANAIAANVLPKAAASNKTVFYHKNGTPKTVEEVYNWMEQKTQSA